MLYDYCQHFLSEISEKKESYVKTLINGCKSWEDYQRLVGKINGLSDAERMISDVFDKMTTGAKIV